MWVPSSDPPSTYAKGWVDCYGPNPIADTELTALSQIWAKRTPVDPKIRITATKAFFHPLSLEGRGMKPRADVSAPAHDRVLADAVEFCRRVRMR